MKFTKSIILGIAASMAMASCDDWLDVNTNPNTPTDVDAAYFQRLPHIEFYTNSAYMFAGMRTNMGLGDWTMNSRTSTYGAYSQWEMSTGPVTTAYQWWFVGAACNLNDMIESATAAGAWHYVGAAYLIKAYGFMLMTDLYGEMPYTEALSTTNTPKYDTGKTIFKGCLEDLDLAIEYLSKSQDGQAVPLATGDYYAMGDVNKWIKMANLFKARWLVKLSKKGVGSASDLKYDADAILACLAKAQTSNADNVVIDHLDNN
ncbi:MAG: SusD/RagB family nutrient-binding outer membrane lipoprotein, partial [Bacteroides sp.]|nr:SusD/RagB family nutrient-binding outer membrane lipoprotein [Bacteroides sp.]